MWSLIQAAKHYPTMNLLLSTTKSERQLIIKKMDYSVGSDSHSPIFRLYSTLSDLMLRMKHGI